MTRSPSILETIITASAERLAQTLRVPCADAPAFVSAVERTLYAEWASRYQGEGVRVRLYVARECRAARVERRNRILRALRAGEHSRAISKRENVSPSWVHRLAKRDDGRDLSGP